MIQSSFMTIDCATLPAVVPSRVGTLVNGCRSQVLHEIATGVPGPQQNLEDAGNQLPTNENRLANFLGNLVSLSAWVQQSEFDPQA